MSLLDAQPSGVFKTPTALPAPIEIPKAYLPSPGGVTLLDVREQQQLTSQYVPVLFGNKVGSGTTTQKSKLSFVEESSGSSDIAGEADGLSSITTFLSQKTPLPWNNNLEEDSLFRSLNFLS